jgi:peptidyl-prolyl cis-trans isomerase C
VSKHLWVALLLTACVGCQKPSSSTPAATRAAKTPASTASSAPAAARPETAAQATSPPKPVPAQLPSVIARINGEDLTKAEFEVALRNLEGRAGRPVPPDQRNEVYRSLLGDLVAFRLVRQEALRRQVPVADAELEEAMKQVRSQFPDEARFKAALASQKMTLPQLRDETRTNLMVSKTIEQEVAAQVVVKPSDISAFYEKNPDKFKQPESVHASHVLVAVQQSAGVPEKTAARAKAESVLKQARAGADFGKLARTYSDDASKQRGGDLGFFPKGQMVPAFEAAAFALQPGQISDLVETPFGFHVIKVLERRPAGTVPFSAVSGQIEEYLKQQQRQEKTKAFVDSLKSKGKVEVLI